MGQSAEELRGNIAQTRENLSGTLDAIEDRVVPGRIVERRKQQLRSRWIEIKEAVMGHADDAGSDSGQAGRALGDRLSDVSGTVQQAPEGARRRAQGNPWAAGAIAFGAGLLAAAVFPGTETEGQVAQKVQAAAQPLAEQAKQAGEDVVSNLQQPAQDAAQQLKDTAAAGVGQVTDSAQQAAQDTKQAASQATSEVQGQAQQSTQVVRDQA